MIGIIALLISILLPSLSAARRQANTVKCMSSLKQIGAALKIYEIENKGYWPVAIFKQVSPMPTNGAIIPTAELEWRWSDLLSKYLHKLPSTGSNDLQRLRANSVLWGCPEWTKASDYVTGSGSIAQADALRNGYGMTYYPVVPVVGYDATTKKPGNLAYLDYTVAAPSIGTWHKATIWTRRGGNGGGGAAERGIIADSVTHIIQASATFSRSGGGFQNGSLGGALGTTALRLPVNTVATYVDVDAQRHLKPGRSYKELRDGKGTNVLYCDGSVRPATPLEAWSALRNCGLGSNLD